MKHERHNAEEFTNFIRDLVSLYVGKPAGLDVKSQEGTDGAVYFALKGAAEDDSRLIGRSGCHVSALTFLVQSLGEANRRAFTFRLVTNQERVSPWYESHDAMDYDPAPAREVLLRFFKLMNAESFEIEVDNGVGPRTTLTYNFNVKISDRAFAESLTSRDDAPGALSVIGCLGTLFRAMAKQHGVQFQIQLGAREEKAN